MSTPSSLSPLNVTRKAEHRVFVGLSWDPNYNPSLFERVLAMIGGRKNEHDLDLSCFYYDEDKKPLGYVTAQPEHYTDASGAIYHSGDNTEGVGDGDDEQISVNLKSLPHTVHHLIFKASVQSAHVFGDVAAPAVRLCDGYTERCFQEDALGRDGDGRAFNSYVFVRLSRADEGWNFAHIGAYEMLNDIKIYTETLRAYLD